MIASSEKAVAGPVIGSGTHVEKSAISELLDNAQNAERSRKWDLATGFWEKLTSVCPDNLTYQLRLLASLRKARDFIAARSTAENLFNRFSHVDSVHRELALLANDSGDHAAAAERWAYLLARNPNDVEAGCGRISALSRQKRFEDAEHLADRLFLAHPTNSQILWSRAWLAHTRSHWPSATERWGTLLKYEPQNSAAAGCFITALTQNKDVDEAERMGLVLQARLPTSVDVARALAWIPHRQQNWPLAAERWRRLVELSPSDSMALGCVATALRHMRRFDEAEEALILATRVDPGKLMHWIDLSKVAHDRGDHVTSSQRWADLRLRYHNDPAALGTIGFHQMQAGFRDIDSRHGTNVALTTTSEDIDADRLGHLFRNTESLGDNCEFGNVQRKFGAEPLGLLRFSSISTRNLVAALRDRFRKLGSPGELTLETIASGEYIIHDAYEITMHSFTHEHEIPREKFHAQISRRVAFLRRKLISDLEDGRKLFVYKDRSGMSLDEAKMVHSAVRTYGTAKLLCVLLSDDANEAGKLEIYGDGLLLGYISSFAAAEGLADSKFDEWLMIIERASTVSN
jgi:tetratricopeptide (TPR) repeat protein